ncbi:cadherin-23 [Toxorhynchites rutilus septentrionalis]|uniref:cadherin-23 n=1 Tax=Toxorhynchites rutilus septentrionalis TaxID=329112 RepID=UPI00247AC84A|nr:cadherin-23 [Toxorhynchites rutilus septentrionalis]XP_055621405.1 cadherin-23 [Toxorhynchites rutilus septentrionalis]
MGRTICDFLWQVLNLVFTKNFVKLYVFKKVRLKVILYLLVVLPSVSCNRPPRFVVENQSEIVLTLKEGPDTSVGSLIYKLKAYDPDGDPLTFGVRDSDDSDYIRVVHSGANEANIYLNRELDRETKDEIHFVLTLSDGRLGDFSVTQSLLLLVEDVNDNEPIFKPFTSAVEVSEDSTPGIIATVEATDRDEGAYGQVVYYLEELDGSNDVFTISTTHGKGVVRLIGSLDYERKSLYHLRILAKDRANQGRINTATAALLVRLKDVEDQPPEFVIASPVTRVSEDAPIGTLVNKVEAIDGDRGVNNRIRYSIAPNNSIPFRIDQHSGMIFTSTKLDREDERNRLNAAYILEVTATEVSQIKPQPSVRTEITIIITDVNDEIPTFRSAAYECEINENSQHNTAVTFLGLERNEVFDYDQGNNGTFDLYLEPDNGAFEILPSRAVNEATFLLRVRDSSLLDFEKNNTLNFSIKAREVATPWRHSVAKVVVHIRDQNDNFPEFSKTMYECYLPENSSKGTLVTQIQAIDVDSGDFGTSGIRFINLSGSIANILALDSLTGVITVEKYGESALDRELVQKHYLSVEARDNLGKGNRNTVQLVVHVLDVNDNPPFFLQNLYEARLLENKLSLETPLIIEARDADLNGTQNSEIWYDIIEGEFKNNFTIDNRTGKLEPRTPIDFELLDGGTFNIRPIHLTVLSFDGGIPKLSSRVPVVIYVQDVNDHPPTFLQSTYVTSIAEDLPSGSTVIEVKAEDGDGSPPNSFIVYRIHSGASDKFVISPDTGVISVAMGATLDLDMTDPRITEYSLRVLALDGGIGEQQLQSFCTVNITITDVNNKTPYFINPGTISIRENTPVGTYTYRLMAHDLDDGHVLRYYLDVNTSEARSEEGVLVKVSEYDYLSAFSLNSTDGVIRVVKLLDREKSEMIKLGLIVKDIAAKNGLQTATTTLTIMIEDENDNNPRFKKSFYKRSIPENSPNGVTIMSVVAFDIDKNKTIQYSLEGLKEETNPLHLDMETGEIVVANKIDHEAFRWLNFTVKATDSGYPPRSTFVEVFIQVIDENDNSPVFSPDVVHFTIHENSLIGTEVAIIHAEDADSGSFGKITYLLDRMSSDGKFSIDPDTGSLVVADHIDREIKNVYALVIEAWDNYQFGYSSGESRNSFKQIFITVLDENDNSPVIQAPNECIQVTEFHDIQEPLLELKATDADDPKTGNGLVNFNIVDIVGLDIFHLKQKEAGTAEIFSSRSLNNLYGNYSLLVMASDGGNPSNHVNKNIDICVLDFNDHAPVFISPSNNSTIRVAENTTIGTNIIQVTAIDSDIGLNAAIKYRFKPDLFGSYRLFSIDEHTGLITLKLQLDREQQKKHELRIEAFDQGVPTSLSSTLELSIYVYTNDCEPQFLVEKINVNFTEHAEPGIEHWKLPDTVNVDEIEDNDFAQTNVCYSIVNGNANNTFQLDPYSHILKVLSELDREIISNYTLLVKATKDCGITLQNRSLSWEDAVFPKVNGGENFRRNYRSYHDLGRQFSEQDMQTGKYTRNRSNNSFLRVQINVQDINDNPPVFVQKIFTGGVTTTSVFGTQFMKLTAIDLDEGIHGQVNYYQTGEIKKTLTEDLENLQNPPFKVDRKTGAVQLNFDPQKGMRGYFDFKVIANDSAGHTDEAHVFIYLLREDQRVKFVLRLQPSELREKIHVFQNALSNVSSCIVNIDDFRIHQNQDGSVDRTKTDLYLHLVNRKDNSILDVSDILKLMDQNIEKLDELFKEFHVLDTQASEASFLTAQLAEKSMQVWLIVSNIFVSSLLVVVLGLCISQRSGYRRQLRAARVTNYANNQPDLMARSILNSVPNTNKHSVEGSNPIWMPSYENEWFKHDDDVTKNISGPESIEENVFNADDYLVKRYNTEKYDIVKQYNLYTKIDKLTNGNILTKKLETTEL